jgi:hypothetical protein
MPSGVIAPTGTYLTTVAPSTSLSFTTINRTDPDYDFPLNKARTWRRIARKQTIYTTRRVTDSRSTNHTCS